MADISKTVLANTIVGGAKLKSMLTIWGRFDKGAELSIIEVGVYRGGVGVLLKNAFPMSSLFLCDTFSGIPYHDEEHDNRHRKGDFGATSLEHVQSLFTCPRVKIIQGIFPGLHYVHTFVVDAPTICATVFFVRRHFPIFGYGFP